VVTVETAEPPRVLTGWRALGATFFVLACVGLGRVGGTTVAASVLGRRGPPETDGVLLAAAILTASLTGASALWLVVRSRHPRSYLALARPSGRAVFAAVAASLTLVLLFDAVRWGSSGVIIPLAWIAIVRTAPVVVLVIAFALAAPCLEESFFRGFLQTTLTSTRVGPRGAIAVTSILFTLAHGPEDAVSFADVLASAVLLGVLRQRTGSIIPGVIAHALGNLQAIVVASILATG